MGGLRQFVRRNIKKVIVLTSPILLLPLPIVLQSKTGSCAYGLLLMAIFWITEALPLAVTALLPVFVFPLLGVSKVKTLAAVYTNNIIFVMIGGLSVAICIEKWNVHKRIALRLVLLMGSQPKWLMLGFMLITCFLSMWMSNTATTAMMIPIAQAVLVQLIETKHKQSRKENETEKPVTEALLDKDVCIECRNDTDAVHLNGSNITKNGVSVVKTEEKASEYSFEFESLDPDSKKLCKAFCLSICYAANCGGIGALTGTPPNLVMKGQADLLSDGQSEITFTSWFIIGFPLSLMTCLISWLVLQIYFFGVKPLFICNRDSSTRVQDVIRMEYNKLGEITFAEKAVFFHFILLVILWFSREPEFIHGWGSLFEDGYLGDSVPAVMVMTSLFIFPSRRREKGNPVDDVIEIPSLLDWKTVTGRMPWNVALLLGGGFALAKACAESGLSLWLADQMAAFKDVNSWLMILVITLISSFATEVTSNTAISSLILPILAELAIGIKMNPIYLMLPAAISTSFAFMLPVATPPNTLAFSYGYLKVIDMVKVGFILNILCVVVVTVAVNTWGTPIFKLDEFPVWAEKFLMSSVETSTSIPSNFTINVNTTM